jgi:hypothetical protein
MQLWLSKKLQLEFMHPTTMRHYLSIIGFSFLYIALVPLAAAQNGCCSWHGGVNSCGYDGYYTCNDGTESPSCTCSGTNSSPATLYDLEYQIIGEGAVACPTIPTLEQSAASQITTLNSQISSILSQETQAVNQIQSQETAAINSAIASSALMGGFGNNGGQISGIKDSYETMIQDTKTQYEFSVKDIQLNVQQYTDFSNFLVKFQQQICSESSNSSSAYQSSQANICKEGFNVINGKCVCNLPGYIDNFGNCKKDTSLTTTPRASVFKPPTVCQTPAPCTCVAGYKPVGNASCSKINETKAINKSSTSYSSSSISSINKSTALPCKKSGLTKTCQCPVNYKANQNRTQCVRR